MSALRYLTLRRTPGRSGCRWNSTDSASTSESPKVSLVEKWKNYWINVFNDYKEVGTGVVEDARRSPLKACGFAGVFGFLAYCFETNPDFRHFRNELAVRSNQLYMVAPPIRNPRAVRHLTRLEETNDEGRLRRVNFGLFSLLWAADHHPEAGHYRANCSYLRPSLSDFHTRILDVGFLDTWWILNREMEDFDVNPDEWKTSV